MSGGDANAFGTGKQGWNVGKHSHTQEVDHGWWGYITTNATTNKAYLTTRFTMDATGDNPTGETRPVNITIHVWIYNNLTEKYDKYVKDNWELKEKFEKHKLKITKELISKYKLADQWLLAFSSYGEPPKRIMGDGELIIPIDEIYNGFRSAKSTGYFNNYLVSYIYPYNDDNDKAIHVFFMAKILQMSVKYEFLSFDEFKEKNWNKF